MGFQNPIVGGTALRIPAIQSPGFQTGVAGWIVRIDGSAEFNNLTIRGEFNGNDFILDSSGLFIYSGTPANGNLIASIAPAAGTDAFSNPYQAGITTYSQAGAASINMLDSDVTLIASNGTVANLFSGTDAGLSLTPAGGTWNPSRLLSGIGGGNHPLVELTSPTDLTNQKHSVIFLEGSSTTDPTTIILSLADRWTHTGAFYTDNIQSGSFSITPTVAGQWTSNTSVTFATAFTNTPVVMVTPSSNGPGVGSTTKLEWQTTGVSTTGFNCRILRDNTTSTTLSWLAVSTN